MTIIVPVDETKGRKAYFASIKASWKVKESIKIRHTHTGLSFVHTRDLRCSSVASYNKADFIIPWWTKVNKGVHYARHGEMAKFKGYKLWDQTLTIHEENPSLCITNKAHTLGKAWIQLMWRTPKYSRHLVKAPEHSIINTLNDNFPFHNVLISKERCSISSR